MTDEKLHFELFLLSLLLLLPLSHVDEKLHFELFLNHFYCYYHSVMTDEKLHFELFLLSLLLLLPLSHD